LFLFVEVADEALFQHTIQVVGDSGDMRAGFREALGCELNSGKVKINSLAFDFVMGDGEGVGPGLERLFGAQGPDPVCLSNRRLVLKGRWAEAAFAGFPCLTRECGVAL
jgi:hypothetical protein